MAIGFALANTIIIQAPKGLIIIDTLDSDEAAENLMEEWRQMNQDPIAAIIYTHSHSDHIGGAMVSRK